MNEKGAGGLSAIPNVALPQQITLSTFVAARVREIQAMKKSINENLGSKMAFQRLPKHMRRRAMSHVVKRLPRRLREIHINQMKKSGLPPKGKKSNRRHRRHPLNLQSEYARRQRRIRWLDTHIWHAKRFHMIEKWGFKLPKQPCDKSFRACYRATTQHCLVQDLSYFRCIEISGNRERIIMQLLKITNNKTGLTFGAKCFHEGKKFGELTVFEPNCDGLEQSRAIGEVQFLWSRSIKERSILWLFVHPAYYKQLLDILVDLYHLSLLNNKGDSKIKSYGNAQGLVLQELEYELGKFRLTGPLSTAVLKNALKIIEFDDTSLKLPPCFNDYPLATLSEQNEIFNNLQTTSYLPPSLALSLIVKDPRLNLPKQRTKALLEDISQDEDFEKFQKNLSLSPLFDESVRSFVTENKMSNKAICEYRSQFLVPEADCSMENKSQIPIILLWRMGNKDTERNGYGSGWDIIVPSSWSQSFFITFIMWGARAGGLRESESITFEKSLPDFLYPDTAAGEQEEKWLTELSKNKFFGLPPNKRTNYNKFAIASPFSFNWKMLISEWSQNTCTQFTVLRNKTDLTSIKEFLSSKTNKFDVPSNSLVPVKIVPIKKGVCSKFSIICIPSQENLVELKQKDLLARKRKVLRQEHKNLLQRLHKRRKRAVKLGKARTPTDANILLNYKTQMRDLWLPEPKTIRNSCSKPVIGFIKHGAFSFSLGQSKGLGYIAADSLKAIAESVPRNKVLIRSPNSRNYQWALLEVI